MIQCNVSYVVSAAPIKYHDWFQIYGIEYPYNLRPGHSQPHVTGLASKKIKVRLAISSDKYCKAELLFNLQAYHHLVHRHGAAAAAGPGGYCPRRRVASSVDGD